jgi:RecA-family ATPase
VSDATALVTPLPVVRADELQQAVAEQQWLIETLWTQYGVGLVGGTPKSLKTWLALELAVAVASGTACLGRFAVKRKGLALIYLAEDQPCDVRQRLQNLCEHRDVAMNQLDVLVITEPCLRLDNERDIERLDATLQQYKPTLLLLDPFVRLHRANENDAQEVARILASLRQLQRKHLCAVVVVHHTRKNQRTGQHGQALRGSGDFHAWADCALYLNHTSYNALQMTIEHRSAATPGPLYLCLVGQPPHPEIVKLDNEQQPGIEDRVLVSLHQSQNPVRRSVLRQLLAINNQRLGQALLILEKQGTIRRTDQGWVAQ